MSTLPDETESDIGPPRVPLRRVAREWTRIGLTGFGGPPAHIALLRELMVDLTGWMAAAEFQDANAACGLLPGPASTQMALFCALPRRGRAGSADRRNRLHRSRGRAHHRALAAVPEP